MQLSFINLIISHRCNADCWFCYLRDQDKHSTKEFDRWNDLKSFLTNADLADRVLVFLASGEVSQNLPLVKKAIREIKKVERVKPVRFTFAYSTNGYDTTNTITLIENGLVEPSSMAISYDGEVNKYHRAKNGVKELGSIVGSVNTALTIDTMDCIESTLNLMRESRVNEWGYYTLLHYPEYNSDEFMDKFKSVFLPEVLKYYRENRSVYNINLFKSQYKEFNPNTQLWCGGLNRLSIDIDIDGNIIPCGIATKYNRYNSIPNTGIDLTEDFDKIRDYVQSFIQGCLHNSCQVNDCPACQCTRCSKNTINSLGQHQFCALRNIEYQFYKDNVLE